MTKREYNQILLSLQFDYARTLKTQIVKSIKEQH